MCMTVVFFYPFHHQLSHLPHVNAAIDVILESALVSLCGSYFLVLDDDWLVFDGYIY